MPTYPVINLETKEKKELSMTMSEYATWREENPGWDKDWNAGVANCGEVGEVYDKLKKSHPIERCLAKGIENASFQCPSCLIFSMPARNKAKLPFHLECPTNK